MYPYDHWFRWILRPRQQHLIDALDHEPDAFRGDGGHMLKRRINGLRRMLIVRGVLATILSLSVIVTIAVYLLDLAGGPEEAITTLRVARAWSTASTGIVTLAYMFTLRTLGQLEIDALMLLPSHRSHWGNDPAAGPPSTSGDDRPGRGHP